MPMKDIDGQNTVTKSLPKGLKRKQVPAFKELSANGQTDKLGNTSTTAITVMTDKLSISQEERHRSRNK